MARPRLFGNVRKSDQKIIIARLSPDARALAESQARKNKISVHGWAEMVLTQAALSGSVAIGA